MLKTSVGRFRAISFVEGLSFVLLLFVAMPLKYMAGMPGMNRVMGMLHGFLFILYVILLMDAAGSEKWSKKQTFLFFMASLVPFGMVWVEKQLRQGREAQPSAALI